MLQLLIEVKNGMDVGQKKKSNLHFHNLLEDVTTTIYQTKIACVSAGMILAVKDKQHVLLFQT